MKKKLIAGILAASLCLAAVSCADTVETTDSTAETTTATEETTLQNETTVDTAASTPTETTTAGGEENPIAAESSDDLESIQIENYLTLRYNAASADVSWEVKKGVGSRATVKLTAAVKDGYHFDGWSENDAIVNGKAVYAKELTCEFSVSASSEKTVFLNTSMTVIYDTNGGSILKDSDRDLFSVVFHQNPNTRPATGFFVRDGYTLTGYNTKADGSGESVSLGSKATGGAGTITLYCMWEKNNADADFETKSSGGGVAITGYKGTSETLVIPEKIGGKNVVTIEKNAFKDASFTRAVIAKSVKRIENSAFDGCANLKTVVFFDTVADFSDNAFSDCGALKEVRINTTTKLLNEWYSCGAAKIDRLIWAKDKKKIIIIGGSGSLYGYDCEVIDNALNGEYEIINFGENAQISAIVYFDIAEDFVREGDIVLWCPEPGTYTLGYPQCSNRFWDFRKSNYDFTKYLNLDYYENFYSSFASFASALSGKGYKEYDALSASMSKYGDDMSSRKWDGICYSYRFSYPMLGKDALTELVGNITAKGASVYFSFAAMQESGMEKVKVPEVDAFEELVTSIPGVVSISDYEDCILSDADFWNSAWHLTDAGSTKRSEQVAKDIKKELGKS